MTDKERADINMSGIPVRGIGGLGLVALAALMTLVFPEAWWLIVAGAAGGVVLGMALIIVHRVHRTSGPSGSDPAILFREDASLDHAATPKPRDVPPDARLAAVR